MNYINIHFLLYFYLKTIQLSCKTVILKFNQFYDDITNYDNLNQNNQDISFYSQLYDNLLYTIINIGEPNQLILGIFNPDSNAFEVNNNEICNKKTYYNYSYINSETAEIIRKIEGNEYFPGSLIINDSIKLDLIEKNQRKKEKIKDFQFKFQEPRKSWGKDEVTNKLYCADIGFQINKEQKTVTQFFKQLKDKNIIDSYKITMNYSSLDNGGFFYIGDFPHEYEQAYFKDFQLISTYEIPRNSFCQFRILMDDIYTIINETKRFIISYKEIFFHLELGLIECPVDYFNFIKNIFFKDYMNKSICSLEYMTKNLNNYNMITCKNDISFNIKSFPPIYFYHSELNKTFELNYNDLFYYEKNKYYFLIIYSSFSGSYWKLGKPFLKKYQITLDLDSKLIYFYDSLKKDNKGEDINNIEDKEIYHIKLKEILLIALCSILFVILFIFLIKGIKKRRKKRANELKDDDYEYAGIDNTNIDNETNKIINNENNSTSIN